MEVLDFWNIGILVESLIRRGAHFDSNILCSVSSSGFLVDSLLLLHHVLLGDRGEGEQLLRGVQHYEN